MSRSAGGAYQSGEKPVEELKPPPGRRSPDHTACHRDIDMLLAELHRLRTALQICADAGREADEALTYRVERQQQESDQR